MRLLMIFVAMVMAMPASAAVSEWIPFDSSNGHITFDVKIDGKTVTAMLDSGATGNGVSQRWLDQNPGVWKKGRKVIIEGVHGERITNYADDVQIELFGVPMEFDDVAPLNLNNHDVLIGLPLFAGYIVQIDYPNSRMRIMDRKAVNLRKFENIEFKHSSGANHPVVRVNINDEFKPWLILDTGSNSGVLVSRQWAEQYGWLDKYATDAGVSSGAVTTGSREFFRIPSFTFGPFKMADVEVAVPGDGEDMNIDNIRSDDRPPTGKLIKRSVRPEGIVGYDVLKHFVLTIDYRRALMNVSTSAE